MRIAILGTGAVGQSLAGKLDALGHQIVVGTRDVRATMKKSAETVPAGARFESWLKGHSSIVLGSFAHAAANGEIIVNATKGTASVDALTAAGEENLNSKVIVDVANPVDLSRGAPPTLSVVNSDSLGEQIQRAFPKSSVVKTLNVVDADVMIDPAVLDGGDHSMFVCGNDVGAKVTVEGLLRGFGWRDIVDLGDITSCRGTEMLVPLWYRIRAAIGTPTFGFKLVRGPGTQEPEDCSPDR